MKKHYHRNLDSLERVFQFVDQFVAQNDIDPSVAFALNLASEEIFVNMVKHNPEGADDIALELILENDRVVVHLTDYDSDPFDIASVQESDAALSGGELKPGGRGLQLVTSVMDKLEYEQDGRISRITVTKLLESTDV